MRSDGWVETAYVESLVTGEREELDTTPPLTGYVAAREAARRDGAPMRIKWHYGKPVNAANYEAGKPVFDYYEFGGKRYAFTQTPPR